MTQWIGGRSGINLRTSVINTTIKAHKSDLVSFVHIRSFWIVKALQCRGVELLMEVVTKTVPSQTTPAWKGKQLQRWTFQLCNELLSVSLLCVHNYIPLEIMEGPKSLEVFDFVGNNFSGGYNFYNLFVANPMSTSILAVSAAGNSTIQEYQLLCSPRLNLPPKHQLLFVRKMPRFQWFNMVQNMFYFEKMYFFL